MTARDRSLDEAYSSLGTHYPTSSLAHDAVKNRDTTYRKIVANAPLGYNAGQNGEGIPQKPTPIWLSHFYSRRKMLLFWAILHLMDVINDNILLLQYALNGQWWLFGLSFLIIFTARLCTTTVLVGSPREWLQHPLSALLCFSDLYPIVEAYHLIKTPANSSEAFAAIRPCFMHPTVVFIEAALETVPQLLLQTQQVISTMHSVDIVPPLQVTLLQLPVDTAHVSLWETLSHLLSSLLSLVFIVISFIPSVLTSLTMATPMPAFLTSTASITHEISSASYLLYSLTLEAVNNTLSLISSLLSIIALPHWSVSLSLLFSVCTIALTLSDIELTDAKNKQVVDVAQQKAGIASIKGVVIIGFRTLEVFSRALIIALLVSCMSAFEFNFSFLIPCSNTFLTHLLKPLSYVSTQITDETMHTVLVSIHIPSAFPALVCLSFVFWVNFKYLKAIQNTHPSYNMSGVHHNPSFPANSQMTPNFPPSNPYQSLPQTPLQASNAGFAAPLPPTPRTGPVPLTPRTGIPTSSAATPSLRASIPPSPQFQRQAYTGTGAHPSAYTQAYTVPPSPLYQRAIPPSPRQGAGMVPPSPGYTSFGRISSSYLNIPGKSISSGLLTPRGFPKMNRTFSQQAVSGSGISGQFTPLSRAPSHANIPSSATNGKSFSLNGDITPILGPSNSTIPSSSAPPPPTPYHVVARNIAATNKTGYSPPPPPPLPWWLYLVYMLVYWEKRVLISSSAPSTYKNVDKTEEGTKKLEKQAENMKKVEKTAMIAVADAVSTSTRMVSKRAYPGFSNPGKQHPENSRKSVNVRSLPSHGTTVIASAISAKSYYLLRTLESLFLLIICVIALYTMQIFTHNAEPNFVSTTPIMDNITSTLQNSLNEQTFAFSARTLHPNLSQWVVLSSNFTPSIDSLLPSSWIPVFSSCLVAIYTFLRNVLVDFITVSPQHMKMCHNMPHLSWIQQIPYIAPYLSSIFTTIFAFFCNIQTIFFDFSQRSSYHMLVVVSLVAVAVTITLAFPFIAYMYKSHMLTLSTPSIADVQSHHQDIYGYTNNVYPTNAHNPQGQARTRNDIITNTLSTPLKMFRNAVLPHLSRMFKIAGSQKNMEIHLSQEQPLQTNTSGIIGNQENPSEFVPPTPLQTMISSSSGISRSKDSGSRIPGTPTSFSTGPMVAIASAPMYIVNSSASNTPTMNPRHPQAMDSWEFSLSGHSHLSGHLPIPPSPSTSLYGLPPPTPLQTSTYMNDQGTYCEPVANKSLNEPRLYVPKYQVETEKYTSASEEVMQSRKNQGLLRKPKITITSSSTSTPPLLPSSTSASAVEKKNLPTSGTAISSRSLLNDPIFTSNSPPTTATGSALHETTLQTANSSEKHILSNSRGEISAPSPKHTPFNPYSSDFLPPHPPLHTHGYNRTLFTTSSLSPFRTAKATRAAKQALVRQRQQTNEVHPEVDRNIHERNIAGVGIGIDMAAGAGVGASVTALTLSHTNSGKLALTGKTPFPTISSHTSTTALPPSSHTAPVTASTADPASSSSGGDAPVALMGVPVVRNGVVYDIIPSIHEDAQTFQRKIEVFMRNGVVDEKESGCGAASGGNNDGNTSHGGSCFASNNSICNDSGSDGNADKDVTIAADNVISNEDNNCENDSRINDSYNSNTSSINLSHLPLLDIVAANSLGLDDGCNSKDEEDESKKNTSIPENGAVSVQNASILGKAVVTDNDVNSIANVQNTNTMSTGDVIVSVLSATYSSSSSTSSASPSSSPSASSPLPISSSSSFPITASNTALSGIPVPSGTFPPRKRRFSLVEASHTIASYPNPHNEAVIAHTTLFVGENTSGSCLGGDGMGNRGLLGVKDTEKGHVKKMRMNNGREKTVLGGIVEKTLQKMDISDRMVAEKALEEAKTLTNAPKHGFSVVFGEEGKDFVHTECTSDDFVPNMRGNGAYVDDVAAMAPPKPRITKNMKIVHIMSSQLPFLAESTSSTTVPSDSATVASSNPPPVSTTPTALFDSLVAASNETTTGLRRSARISKSRPRDDILRAKDGR